MKQALLIPIIALTIVGGTLIAVMPAQAQSFRPEREVLAGKFSQRFGVPTTQVESVMVEVQQAHRAQRQEKLEEHLTDPVAKGNITEAQKSAILAKHQELLATWEAGREQFRTMSPEERKEAREKALVELQNWAEENGIDLKFFMIMRHGTGKIMPS